MPRQPVTIDRDELRAAVRKLGHEYVFYMLDDAIDLLPPAKLHQIAKKYLDIKSLRPDSEIKTKANLLAAVKAFDKVSRAGEYYESFMVRQVEFMPGEAIISAAAREQGKPQARVGPSAPSCWRPRPTSCQANAKRVKANQGAAGVDGQSVGADAPRGSVAFARKTTSLALDTGLQTHKHVSCGFLICHLCMRDPYLVFFL